MACGDYTNCGPCPTCGRCRCCNGDNFSLGSPSWQDTTSNPIGYNDDIICGINNLISKARVDGSCIITGDDIQAALRGENNAKS